MSRPYRADVDMSFKPRALPWADMVRPAWSITNWRMGRTSDYKLIIHCMILSKHTAQNSHGVAQKAANCGERTEGLSETYNLTNVPKVPH